MFSILRYIHLCYRNIGVAYLLYKFLCLSLRLGWPIFIDNPLAFKKFIRVIFAWWHFHTHGYGEQNIVTRISFLYAFKPSTNFPSLSFLLFFIIKIGDTYMYVLKFGLKYCLPFSSFLLLFVLLSFFSKSLNGCLYICL